MSIRLKSTPESIPAEVATNVPFSKSKAAKAKPRSAPPVPMSPAKNPATPPALTAFNLVAAILVAGFQSRKKLKLIELKLQFGAQICAYDNGRYTWQAKQQKESKLNVPPEKRQLGRIAGHMKDTR